MPFRRLTFASSVALALAVAACGGGDEGPSSGAGVVPGAASPGPALTDSGSPVAGSTPVLTPFPAASATPRPDRVAVPTRVPDPTATPRPTITPTPGHTLSQAEREAIATRFIEALAAGDFEAAVALFDAATADALPVGDLSELWTQIAGQAGEYVTLLGFSESELGIYRLLVAEALFQGFVIDLRLTFDTQGQIAGPFYGVNRPADGYPAPGYADETAFDEFSVVVGIDGGWPLPGTLSMPHGTSTFPVVILVHGSGPGDRDETVGLIKPFRDLAWGLASRGIAVLRYEKRTLEHRDRLAASPGPFTLADETVDDVLAAVDLSHQFGRIDLDRIFVLGHSLGGYAIPRIAERTEAVAGYIVLAGAARPIPDLLIEQLEYIAALDGRITADERAEIDGAQATVGELNALQPGEDPTALLLGAPAAYWLDLRDYAPADAAKAIEAPMLVLQGGADYQVTVQDYGLWRDALGDRDDVQLTLYPGLNHFFVEIEGKSTPRDALGGGHVSERVVDDIADWVSRH